jgi:hypothetical protein
VHGFYCCPTAVGEHKYQCKIGHLGACQCVGSECHRRGHGGHSSSLRSGFLQMAAGAMLLVCCCVLPACARAGQRRQFQVINGPTGPACSSYGGGGGGLGAGAAGAMGFLGGMFVGEQIGRWEDRYDGGFGGGGGDYGGGGDGGDIAADFGGGDGDF